jgi:hypothetical protein
MVAKLDMRFTFGWVFPELFKLGSVRSHLINWNGILGVSWMKAVHSRFPLKTGDIITASKYFPQADPKSWMR